MSREMIVGGRQVLVGGRQTLVGRDYDELLEMGADPAPAAPMLLHPEPPHPDAPHPDAPHPHHHHHHHPHAPHPEHPAPPYAAHPAAPHLVAMHGHPAPPHLAHLAPPPPHFMEHGMHPQHPQHHHHPAPPHMQQHEGHHHESARGGRMRVIKEEPTHSRQFPIGFQMDQVAAGDEEDIEVKPQVLFRGERLAIAQSIARYFDVLDIKVGKDSQLAATGALTGEAFETRAVGVRMELDTAEPGIVITLRIKNVDTAAHDFKAVLYGAVLE